MVAENFDCSLSDEEIRQVIDGLFDDMWSIDAPVYDSVEAVYKARQQDERPDAEPTQVEHSTASE